MSASASDFGPEIPTFLNLHFIPIPFLRLKGLKKPILKPSTGEMGGEQRQLAGHSALQGFEEERARPLFCWIF